MCFSNGATCSDAWQHGNRNGEGSVLDLNLQMHSYLDTLISVCPNACPRIHTTKEMHVLHRYL